MKIDATTVAIEIEERKVEASDAQASVFVNVIARPVLGLDRSHVYGWSVGPMSAKAVNLAARLQAAVLAGKAFQGPAETKRDVNGRTYLSAPSCQIMGRHMNADLRKLGF